MTCECYRIGGRFIAEDPDCHEHGTEAVRRQIENETQMERIEEALQELYNQETTPQDVMELIRSLSLS